MAAYPTVHKTIYYCAHFLIGYGINFWPFVEIVHHNENISVSGIADGKRACYVYWYPLEKYSGVICCSSFRVIFTGPLAAMH